MDELERRLREALHDVTEPPPAGLLAGVRRRHRRHQWRVGAGWVAGVAVVAVALPPVASAVRGNEPPSGPAAPASSPGPRPSAVAGTGLVDCDTQDNGELTADWQARSRHVGSAWFVYARLAGGWRTGLKSEHDTIPPRNIGPPRAPHSMIIAVPNGSTTEISAIPAQRSSLRFTLPSSSGATSSAPSAGPSGLTVVGCPAGPVSSGLPAAYAAGLTLYWIGYTTNLRPCLTLEVRRLPDGPPARVTLAASGGRCPAR